MRTGLLRVMAEAVFFGIKVIKNFCNLDNLELVFSRFVHILLC